jgi:hypothetical protein
MNVYRTNALSDDTIDTIKNLLITADHSNDDLSVTLKGRIHNNTGFILTASNMEKMPDLIFDEWKSIVKQHGYNCSFQYDFQEGWVDIKCERKRKKVCLKGAHFQTMGYLSLILFCIYLLWYRQNRLLQP